MIELQDIWNDRNLSKDLKVRLGKALVWSALIPQKPINRIMSAEMWILKKRKEQKLTNLQAVSLMLNMLKGTGVNKDLWCEHGER